MVIASIALARTELASKKTHISNNHLLVINPYADFMTKTSIRKFALELQYSNMIIVARITFIYKWLLNNFFIFYRMAKNSINVSTGAMRKPSQEVCP